MKLQDLKEYNGVETYFHVTTAWNCNQIAKHALEVGKLELIGRPLGDHEETRQRTEWSEYVGWSEGVAYGTDVYNRDNCWDYAGESRFSGAMFVLGWTGKLDKEATDECGEYVVPLDAYEVVAVVVLNEDDQEIVFEPMEWVDVR